MITLAVNDILEAAFVCSQGSQLGIMVRHWYVFSITGASSTDQSFALALSQVIGPDIRALLTSHANFLGVRATRLFPLPRALTVTSNAQAGPGTVAGDPLPKQVAGVITLLSNGAGRGYRGRAYMPFPSEGSNGVTSIPTAAYVGDLEGLGQDFVATIIAGAGADTATLRPIILNRAANTFVELVSSRANARWGTQRRRGDYGQSNAITL